MCSVHLYLLYNVINDYITICITSWPLCMYNCTMFAVQYSTVDCTLYSTVDCTLYSIVDCTVYTVQCTVQYSTVQYTVHCTVQYTVHCTLQLKIWQNVQNLRNNLFYIFISVQDFFLDEMPENLDNVTLDSFKDKIILDRPVITGRENTHFPAHFFTRSFSSSLYHPLMSTFMPSPY